MKTKTILPILAAALALSAPAKANPPSGVEMNAGMESLKITREGFEPYTVKGMRLSLDLVNARVGNFSFDTKLTYRDMVKDVNGLETLTVSAKPMYVFLERFGTLYAQLSGGMSAIYHRIASDRIQLNEVVGIAFSYGRIFVAPRVKLVTTLFDSAYSEIGVEVGAMLHDKDAFPYGGLDARLGYEHDFTKNISVNASIFEEGRISKGERYGDLGIELRAKIHPKAPRLVLKGFLHNEKSDYFKGSGMGFYAGLGLF